MKRDNLVFPLAAWLLLMSATMLPAQVKTVRPPVSVQRLAEAPPPQPANHHLTPNDLIQIKVFQEDELLTMTRIGRDNTIVFPLIGKVKVGGLSVAEASKIIRDLLEKEQIVKPQVIITLLEFAQQRFTILGQVQKPGTYDYPAEQPLSLLAAIGYAGGYTRIARPQKVFVKRKVGGKEVVYQLDAKKMAQDPGAPVFEIQPNDIITIEESMF